MAPSSTLEALPPESLEEICAMIDAAHRPSIYTIALVSKSYRRAARQFLFRSLYLDVKNTHQLCDNVNQLYDGLHASGSFGYVRDFWITGELSHSHPIDGIKGLGQAPQNDEKINETWDLVARLLERLTALENITYKGRAPFPPSLLAALHNSPSLESRLHLLDFCPHVFLSGLVSDTSEPARLDPYALQLLKSANLYEVGFCRHKITCTAGESMSRDEADYVIEAVLELAFRYSPSLKEIVCLWRAIPDARIPRELGIIHRSPWSGLLLDHANTPAERKGKLISLTVGWRSGIVDPNGRRGVGGMVHNGGRGGVDLYVFEAWNQRIDLSTLRTLKLVDRVPSEVMSRLVTNARRLVSLSSLQIHASRELDDFLHALRPLAELQIIGDFGRTIPPAIFDPHGPMLRRLSLLRLGKVFKPYIHEPASFVCSSKDIKEFRAHCPVLEELTILVSRSQGNSDEQAIYHELGSHPRLQKIHLTLECSVDVRGDATFEDAFEQ